METLKKLGILIFVQIAFITVIFLVITCVRFLDINSFQSLKNEYEKYARFDVNKSLVYEGNSD